jgi:hypothetical protein
MVEYMTPEVERVEREHESVVMEKHRSDNGAENRRTPRELGLSIGGVSRRS